MALKWIFFKVWSFISLESFWWWSEMGIYFYFSSMWKDISWIAHILHWLVMRLLSYIYVTFKSGSISGSSVLKLLSICQFLHQYYILLITSGFVKFWYLVGQLFSIEHWRSLFRTCLINEILDLIFNYWMN